MTHITFPNIDSLVSYSNIWIKTLRERLAFEGIVFSDDLSMKGAGDYSTVKRQLNRSKLALIWFYLIIMMEQWMLLMHLKK